jgi:hypothetical protein
MPVGDERDLVVIKDLHLFKILDVMVLRMIAASDTKSGVILSTVDIHFP